MPTSTLETRSRSRRSPNNSKPVYHGSSFGQESAFSREKEGVMSVRRLDSIPGFNIDRVAAASGDDPEMLRMEKLDTDMASAGAALEASRAALGAHAANSWLRFTEGDDLHAAVP